MSHWGTDNCTAGHLGLSSGAPLTVRDRDAIPRLLCGQVLYCTSQDASLGWAPCLSPSVREETAEQSARRIEQRQSRFDCLQAPHPGHTIFPPPVAPGPGTGPGQQQGGLLSPVPTHLPFPVIKHNSNSQGPHPSLQEGGGQVLCEAPEPRFRTRLSQVGLSTLLHLPSWAGGESQECFVQAQSLPLLRRHYVAPGLQRS